MNTETIHILIAACTLIAAGITSFPYRLSYGNTSWLPWWMQPDCRYLERPYEYDYPARNINLLFSVSVMVIGILAMLFILTPDLPDDVPAERWFAALAVLYPAYASCQVLFWRKDYGDGFCYADRITSFSYGKVYLKSATKLFSVLLASKRPLITELADKLRLKYPLLPTISPCPTMRLEAIRSIIPISCRRYPKSV